MTTLDEARRRGLVLDAEGIPYHLARHDTGEWTLVVAPSDAERTAAALAAYERENATAAAAPMPPASTPGGRWIGIAAGALLAAFHALTGPRAGGSAWFDRGAADSGAILSGAWYRVVTALTLHADGAHVLANALSGALFFGLVAEVFGPGFGLALIVAAGAAGNLATAAVRGPGSSGVGASTAVFAAVGILAGAQWARHRAGGAGRGRAWVPVAAGIGLFVLLGTAPDTDVLAHTFGFLAGLAAGFAARRRSNGAPGAVGQWLGTGAALAAIAAAWAAAWASE